MIFIDRKVIPIPEVFNSKELQLAQKRLEEFYARSKDSRSQERYNKPFDTKLRDGFLQPLRQLFNDKCAYCESKIILATSTSEYDHFRPKSGARGLESEFDNEHYWWLTFEWNNLYYCCQVCNRFKSTWFPVEGKRIKSRTPYNEIIRKEKNLILDPCNDKPEHHLAYEQNGHVNFLSPAGNITIEMLKLNRSELVHERKETAKNLFGQWELFSKLFKKNGTNRKQLKEIAEEWGTIFNQFSPRPYLAIQRQLLSKWIEDRADIQKYLRDQEYNAETAKQISYIPITERIFHTEELKEEEKEKIIERFHVETIKHIYIEKIELENFKCFSELNVSFVNNDLSSANLQSNEDFITEPWLLFLGENGVGKSSILKAITIGLAGKEYIAELGITGKDIIKHGETNGYIKIHLIGSVNPIEVHFSETEIKTNIFQPIVNLVAYNSIRLRPKKGSLKPEKGHFYGAKAKNLFDYTVSLIDADSWLLTRSKTIFDRVALTLKDLMLLNEKDRIEKEGGKIIVRRNGKPFSIDELSDGYQSVYALAVDIMATLVKDNVTFDLAEGVVLIDEIGTHLHPRWRMQVVERLRNAFPKIRFVVTTHEPLCLRGLKAGETIVLTKSEEDIIAITDLPDPSELRIDQILTSDFFGLKSTIDLKTEKIFEEYYAILALDEVDRTDLQKNQLLELSELIPRIKHLGDTPREELICYVVDELLAKKARSEEFKTVEAIKPEALKRVESLWNLISTEKNRNI